MATTNLGKVAVVPRGEYAADVQYEKLDIVQYERQSYLVKQSVHGVIPSTGSEYVLLAGRGDSSYEVAVKNGYVGTEAEWLLHIKADGSIQALQKFMTNPAETSVQVPDYGTIPSLQGYIKEMFENGGIPATPFETKALMEAAELDVGSYAIVTNDAPSINGLYVKSASGWTKSQYDSDAKLFEPEKNLIPPNSFIAGSYISPSSGIISPSSAYRRTDFIPVKPNTAYIVSGVPDTAVGMFDVADESKTALFSAPSHKFTTTEATRFVVLNVTGAGGSNTTYDDKIQLEEGDIATAYEPYNLVLKKEILGSDYFPASELIERSSFNKINPDKVEFNRRYSTGSMGYTSDSLLIAATEKIKVTEGEWYTVSGTAVYGLGTGSVNNLQGGYFSGEAATKAVSNVTFVEPVTGVGAAFKVPTDLGITHVVISLKKTAENALDGYAQLEQGEMKTDYQPYYERTLIKKSFLPSMGGGSTTATSGLDTESWYKFTQADGGKIYQDKLPKFRKAMMLKNEDVVVVNAGTSLTARTSEHSTVYQDADSRPPMMHSRAFCSLVWDAMKWSNQSYSRYDKSGIFTETGTFATSSNLAEWDDGAYRDGLTRYSAATNAAVSFTVPIDAWQFNFIYRTDSLGCAAKVAIAEGVGKMQVYDEVTSAWVEANDYTFSMLETAPVARTISMPSVITGTASNITVPSKGNTTYQKRLKMRCKNSTTLDSLATAKMVTISRTGGGSRFMYWGVEHSPREFMITYINAARGSHNTNAASSVGLPRYQDNEIWSFKPTLILSELGIHNDGASGAASSPVGQWAGLTHSYVTNTDFELSMYSRAAHFGLEPEYAFFMGSTTWNFGGINEDGTLKLGMQSASVKGAARMMSSLDKYQEAIEFLRSNDIVAIDTSKRWVDAGNAIFGDLKSATVGSGKDGRTLTNEGSHWNDTGSKIMAKAIIPIIKTY